MKKPSGDIRKLLEETKPEKQQPDDITTAMLCEAWDMVAITAVRNRARKVLVPKGYVEITDVLLDNGATGTVYRPIDPE